MLAIGKYWRICWVFALLWCALPSAVFANPVGGVVSAGQATIASSAKKVDINQQSNKAVIDWRGFDIAPDETTAFHQPSASSLTLNRVNSNSASTIDGKLTANGNIVIVNQNGVLFGNNAKVDVNGIIATTANISNDKFMNNNGKLVFDQAGNPNAQIINNGTITAKDAGLVGLVAPSVINNGMIVARLGKVTLASGDTTTVDLYGDSLMEVAVSDKVQAQLVGNTGTIKANGGKVALLTATTAREVVDSLTNTGLVQANSVAEKDGEIILSANNVTNATTGTISAQGDNAGENGGKVTIAANTLKQDGAIKVDASKQAGIVAITATESVKQNGRITATGEAGGKVVINTKTLEQAGTIDVSGQKQGGKINVVATDVKQTGNLIATGETGGKVTITAKKLEQNGTINVNGQKQGGTVTITATDLIQNGTITATGQLGGAVNVSADTLEQNGTINVDGQKQGGSVTMQIAQMYSDGALAKITAQGIAGTGGLIHIEATDNGSLSATGTYITSGNSTGGIIELLAGQNVNILGAIVNASGRLGGGIIRIGGDFQGKGNTRRAKTTTVDKNTELEADATDSGNGGKIIVWSDDNTNFAGHASAQGGALSGDGGLVETSGHMLSMTGGVTTNAPNGKTGTLLLDPDDITISTSASSGTMSNCLTGTCSDSSATSPSNLNNGTLQTALGSTNVIVTTSSGSGGSGDITVNNTITWNSANSLTLNADRDIVTNAAITNNGSGAITLSAYRNITVNAAITLAGSGRLELHSANADDGTGIHPGYVAVNANLTTISGDIVIGGGNGVISAGSGYAYGDNVTKYGIYFLGAALHTIDAGSGNIILNGHGGNAAAGNNYGVLFDYGTRYTFKSTGTINIYGKSGSFTGDQGVAVNDLVTLGSSNGTFNFYATSTGIGTGYGTFFNPGVYGAGFSSAGSGAINIYANSISGTDFRMVAGDTIGGPSYSGNITINSNLMYVQGGSIQTTGSVTLAPYTQNTSIGVMGGAGTLQLNATNPYSVLSAITAPNIIIGRPDGTGAISLGANTWGSNLTLQSQSGQITISGVQTMGAHNLTIITDSDLALSNTISGTGALVIAPQSIGTSIGIGTVAGGTLNLTSTEMGKITAGWSSETFGRADGTGGVNITTASYADNTYIYGGTMTFNSSLTPAKNLTIGSTANIGNVTITSAAGNVTIASTNDVLLQSSTITTNGGTIIIDADSNGDHTGRVIVNNLDTTGGGTHPAGGDIYIGGGTDPTTNPTSVTGYAYGGATNTNGNANVGVTLYGASAYNAGTSGTITMHGWGGTYNSGAVGNNHGIYNQNGIITLKAATINMFGHGGDDATNNGTSNIGVYLGVYKTDLTNVGTLNVTGTGGTSTGTGNNGAEIAYGGQIYSSGSGAINFTGIAGGANSYGIKMSGGGAFALGVYLGSTYTGNIVLTADKLSIAGGTIQTTGAGTVTLATNTNTSIGIAAGAAGTLQISQAILNLITTPNLIITNLIIGRTDGTGAITANATNWASNTTLQSDTGVMSISGNQVLGANNLTINTNSNSTISGVISGTGSLIKAGSGTLTLSGANTYTGGTTVNAGTLKAGVITNAFGSNSAVTVAGGATLNLNSLSETVGSIAGAGSITSAGAATLTAGNDNSSTPYSGVMSGPVSLTKVGSGILTLSGVNTYTGVTTINAGVLSVGTIGAGGAAGNLGAATNAAANLVLGGGTLQYTGGTASTDRNFTLTNGTTSSIDVSTGATVLTVTGSAASTTGALTKIGSGTLILSGTNSYTGATTINAGTLKLGANNALGATAVSVASGATFDLNSKSDSITSLTTVSGSSVTLGTGNTLTTAGAQTYAGTVSSTGTVHLVSTGGGDITANNTGNGFFSGGDLYISTTTGTVSIVNASALTLNTVTAKKFFAQAISGDLTLNGVITTTDTTGKPLVLVTTGGFKNYVGSGVFVTNGGFWMVYSNQAANDTAGQSTLGGTVTPGHAYNAGDVSPAANMWYYSTAGGNVVITLTAPASLTYGSAIPTLTYSCGGSCPTLTGGTVYIIDGSLGHQAASALAIHANSLDASGTPYNFGGNLTATGYTFTYSGGITVNKATPTVTVTAYNSTYTGLPQTATYVFSGVNGESGATVGSINVSGTTHTNAATYNNDAWSFAGGSNYTNTSGTVNDVIGKATLTITVQNQTIPLNSTVPAGTVLYSGWAGGENETIPGVITTQPTISSTIPVNTTMNVAGTIVGNYSSSGAVAPNYNISYIFGPGHGDLIVSSSGVVNVIVNSGAIPSRPYGAANPNLNLSSSYYTIDCTPSCGSNPIQSGTPFLSTLADVHTNVGTAQIDIAIGSLQLGVGFTDYAFNFVPGTLSITKATPTIVVTPYNTTYNGLAHTATITSITGANGETNATVGTVTLNTTHTNANTYVADSWSFTGTGNYSDISSTTITDIIGKATPTVTVTPYNTTYDGSTHTATVTSITGVNGETNATVGTVALNTTHTNANNYAGDTWSFTGTGNYNDISPTTITDIIGKATPTVVVTPYNITYDGLSHSATYTITGVNGETNGTVGTIDVSGTTHTNANTYAADSWSFMGSGNYNNISPTSITDIIGKATPTVVVTPYNITYDGLSHSATYTISGVNGETNGTVGTIDVSGTTHTNANTYNSDAWTLTGTSNYNNIGNTTITDTINQKTVTLSATKPYDGNTSLTGDVVVGTAGATGIGSETLGVVDTSAVAFSKDAGPGNYITGGVTLADGTNGGLAANYALPDLTSANANNSVTITGGSPPPPPPHPTPTPTPVPTPTPTPTPVPTPTPTPTPVVVPVPTIPSTVVRVSVNPELNFTSSNDFGGVAVDVIKQTSDIFKQFGAQNDNGRFVFDNYAPISDVLFLTPANMGLMDTSIHGSANPSTAAPANENTSNHSNDNAKEKAANDNKQGNTKSQATQRQQLLTVDPFLAQEFEIDQRKFQF